MKFQIPFQKLNFRMMPKAEILSYLFWKNKNSLRKSRFRCRGWRRDTSQWTEGQWLEHDPCRENPRRARLVSSKSITNFANLRAKLTLFKQKLLSVRSALPTIEPTQASIFSRQSYKAKDFPSVRRMDERWLKYDPMTEVENCVACWNSQFTVIATTSSTKLCARTMLFG